MISNTTIARADEAVRYNELKQALYEEIARLTRERDEAQAANVVCRRDIEALMSSCDKLERERDVAIAERQRLETSLTEYRDAHDRVAAERDALREAARKIAEHPLTVQLLAADWLSDEAQVILHVPQLSPVPTLTAGDFRALARSLTREVAG